MNIGIGVGLALGNRASTILLPVASVVLYSYRIAVEEKIFLTNIGEPYRAFMACRKQLAPYVY